MSYTVKIISLNNIPTPPVPFCRAAALAAKGAWNIISHLSQDRVFIDDSVKSGVVGSLCGAAKGAADLLIALDKVSMVIDVYATCVQAIALFAENTLDLPSMLSFIYFIRSSCTIHGIKLCSIGYIVSRLWGADNEIRWYKLPSPPHCLSTVLNVGLEGSSLLPSR